MAKAVQKFVNRELSWLEFNARLLQEADDNTVPIIDKMRFLGIYANNLDEFFRVRVATLKRTIEIETKLQRKSYLKKLNSILKQINKIDNDLSIEFNEILQRNIKQLEDKNIFIINEFQLTEDQGLYIKKYFKQHVRSLLFPIMLNNIKSSSLKDDNIYLAIELYGNTTEDAAIIKIPVNSIPRFIILPSSGYKKYIILIDDVIRYCLSDIFGLFGFTDFKAFTFKFTRDAELDIDNDVSKSLLETISESLKQRSISNAVRFSYDKDMPLSLLNKLTNALHIPVNQELIKGERYQNFKDFINFPSLGRADLQSVKFNELDHKYLLKNNSIFNVIKDRDIMLHYPYQSFDYIIDLLREASIDKQVRSIKMTLYRVARDSNIINALINAARNGKSVTVFLEIQARFDEEANIHWAEKLQNEGVKIIQSIPGFKVHCKLLIIKRKENNEDVFYTNISSGNFNEQTAKVYADNCLLTANQEIAQDANNIFKLFESKFTPHTFKHLIVAPFSLRNAFNKLINNEINNAKNNKEAWCIIKSNNFTDEKIAAKIYKAAKSGVKVDILCRGACTIIPKMNGINDNLTATGIIDIFLEHSRIYVFCNGGNEKYFISSADIMVRNLDNRVEIMCPIYDKSIQKELKTILKLQIKDNTKSRLINNFPKNEYNNKYGKTKIRSQFEIYNFLMNEKEYCCN